MTNKQQEDWEKEFDEELSGILLSAFSKYEIKKFIRNTIDSEREKIANEIEEIQIKESDSYSLMQYLKERLRDN